MVERAAPDPEFEALLRHIQESRGLDFCGYKRTSLRRRITLRMETVNRDDFAAYRAYLEAQPSEYEELLNTVLINVTSFRDEDAWNVIRDQVIAEILGNAEEDRPIRVWSVGDASGEEPYSIAMLPKSFRRFSCRWETNSDRRCCARHAGRRDGKTGRFQRITPNGSYIQQRHPKRTVAKVQHSGHHGVPSRMSAVLRSSPGTRQSQMSQP